MTDSDANAVATDTEAKEILSPSDIVRVPVTMVAEAGAWVPAGAKGFPLSDAQHAAIKAQITALPELIVTAAIRYDGLIITVERPGRHGNCINVMHGLGLPHSDQGFMTSHGRFVDRKEGGLIAVAAGQTTTREGCNGHLFSEDCWNDTDRQRSAK